MKISYLKCCVLFITVIFCMTIVAGKPISTSSQNEWSLNCATQQMGVNDILMLQDGSLVAIGYPISGGVAVMKFSQTGGVLWKRTFDYGQRNADYQTAIDKGVTAIQARDGSLLIIGQIENYEYDASLHHNGQIWLIKMDQQGNTLWQKYIGRSGYDYSPEQIIEAADGSIVIDGCEYQDYNGRLICKALIFKTDANGNVLWQKPINSNSYGAFSKFFQTSDGGYFIVGHDNVQGSCTRWLVKLDASGTKVWEKYYSGIGDGDRYKLLPITDGYMLMMRYKSGSTEYTGMIKVSQEGTIVWEKRIAGTSGTFYNFISTPDGGYVLIGTTLYQDNGDVLAVKLNSDCSIAWRKTYTATPDAADSACFVLPTATGYAIFSHANSAYSYTTQQYTSTGLITTIDANGAQTASRSLQYGYNLQMNDALPLPDNCFVVLTQVEGMQSGAYYNNSMLYKYKL